jgi:hypothetical protein
MGEMADYLTEQEGHLLTLHETGRCGELGGPCPYCEAGDAEEAKVEQEVNDD